MTRPIQSVAVVGGGPAGSTLATLLARGGLNVVLYDSRKRPPLLVGESLVPAIVPILRLLGVENEVRSYSMYKPGATFRMAPERDEIHFDFSRFESSVPPYTYNSPRDRFDETLFQAAKRAGAHIVEAPAKIALGTNGREIELTPESVDAAGGKLNGQPDFIVDATGRNRTIAKLLDIPIHEGGRKDTALFAHIDHAKTTNPGYIHISRLTHGWNWFIPLVDCMSLGMVIDSEAVKQYGASKEEQYDNMLRQEPLLREYAEGAKRFTPVMKYTNYQIVSNRCVGKNWALVGDVAGFVDPIFSSGLYVAMDGAVQLANALLKGTPKALAEYEASTIRHIANWHTVVEYFYSGQLFTFFNIGEEKKDTFIGKVVDPHFRKHFGRVFTGAAVKQWYSRNLLNFMIRRTMFMVDSTPMRIN